MKKLTCIFLVAAMMFATLSLTAFAANDEADGWKTTYDIATDNEGDPLTAHRVQGKEWIENEYGLGCNNSTGLGAGEGIILFEEKANYAEATFVRSPGTVDAAKESGIVFCVNEVDGNWDFWNSGAHYYLLSIDADNVLRLHRYDFNIQSFTDLVGGADRKDLDNGYDLTAGVKLAAEWDDEGNIKAYINDTLVYSVKDDNPLEGDYHGLRMRAYWKSRLFVSSYKAYEKQVSAPETGDATALTAIVAVVAVMGMGIAACKKRRFN